MCLYIHTVAAYILTYTPLIMFDFIVYVFSLRTKSVAFLAQGKILQCKMRFESVKDLPPVLQFLLVPLLPRIQKLLPLVIRCLVLFELFCGQAANTKALKALGYNAEGFDKIRGPIEDILEDCGYDLALFYTLCLLEGASFWSGLECSTFIFMARNGTGRTVWKPEGNYNCRRVRNANIMASRSIALMTIAHLRKVHTFMEQPLSSLAPHLEVVEVYINYVLLFQTTTFLGAYGGEYAKGIHVWSSSPDVELLRRGKVSSHKKLAIKTKSGAVNGIRHRLKKSRGIRQSLGSSLQNLSRSCT